MRSLGQWEKEFWEVTTLSVTFIWERGPGTWPMRGGCKVGMEEGTREGKGWFIPVFPEDNKKKRK